MEKKKRAGLQIRFSPDSEQDVIEFLSPLKKAEVHITVISAFRMYMKSVGFYERTQFVNSLMPGVSIHQEKDESRIEERKTDTENEGLFDEEGFKTLDTMFDEENDLSV